MINKIIQFIIDYGWACLLGVILGIPYDSIIKKSI